MNEPSDLANDPFLRDVPVIEGYKTLGPCVLFAKLGQGGMGAVYRARHLNLDIDVAVKCLLPNIGQGGSDAVRREAVQRFVREARVAAQLGHENLVRVFDVAEAQGVHYLVMEFVDGETLRGRVQRKGALPLGEAVTITLAAARGLAAAHRKGIIHRDIKPDNVMISREGEVKLADLGLARAAEAVDSLATSRGAIMGTPSFMPPEQFVDASQVGPAADIWSLGATLYFLLTGENGISATTPVQAMHQVCNVGFPALPATAAAGSTDLAALVDRCMRAEESERFADAGELAQALVELRVAPESATLLSDAEAVPETVLGLVSPPPAKSLDRIRTLASSGQSSWNLEGLDETVTSAGASRSPSAAEATIPSTERAVSAPAPVTKGGRGVLVPVLLVALLALGGFSAWSAGLFEGEKESEADASPATRASVENEERRVDGGEGKGQDENRVAQEPEPERKQDEAPEKIEAKDENPRGEDEASSDGIPEKAEAEESEADSSAVPPPVVAPEADVPTIAERMNAARALVRDPETLGAGIDQLRALALEAPQTVGLGPALAGALRAQATDFKNAARWGDALRSCRESLDVTENPQARRMEGELIGKIREAMTAAVTLQLPGEAGLVKDAQLELGGQLDSNLVREIRMGDESLEVFGGRFRRDWTAPGAGEHEISLIAVGPEGVEVPIKAQLRVDLMPPQITITSPSPGASVSGDGVDISGTVRDDLQVIDLRFVVGEDKSPIPLDDEGRFRARFRFDPAQQGRVEIALLATDAAGREGRAKLSVERPPQAVRVRLVEPSDRALASGRRPLPVTLELLSGQVRGSLNINGRKAAKLGRNPVRYRGNLRSGEDRLRVELPPADGSGASLLIDRAVPLLRVPAWARVKVGAAFEPKSGLPRALSDKRTGIEFVLIPAGSYERGVSAADDLAQPDEKPRHRVTISRPFYLGKYEVTNAQYQRFRPKHKAPAVGGLSLQGSQNPVVHVAWTDAQAFCAEYGLRLPTEAEWEYAARAGVTTRYPWGQAAKDGLGWASLAGPASNRRFWFGLKPVFPFDDGFDVTAPVGKFRANAFGLHDMTGNVWEWCADHYDAQHYAGLAAGVRDPRGPATGAGRVLRGGSWQNEPPKLRLSARGWLPPPSSFPDLGFRVARDI